MIRKLLVKYNSVSMQTRYILNFLLQVHFFILLMVIASFVAPGIVKQMHVVRYMFSPHDWNILQYAVGYIMFFLIASGIYFFLPSNTIKINPESEDEKTESGMLSVIMLEMINKIREYEDKSKEVNENYYLKNSQMLAIIDLVPIFIFAKDADGKFFIGNKAVADCYGVHPKELFRKTDSDFCDNEGQVTSFNDDDKRVLTTLKPLYNIREVITCDNGHSRHLLTHKIPIKMLNGKVGVLGVSQDVTPITDCAAGLIAEIEKYFANKVHCNSAGLNG